MTRKRNCQIWRGIGSSFQSWHKEFDGFWLENLKVSKIYTLMGCFWPKYVIFELKKYRGAIFHDTSVRYKIWRKADLWFGTWHEEFSKFSSEHVLKPKNCDGVPFIQNRKCISLKFTGKYCLIKMKNDAKLEDELPCQFKIDMTNLTIFDPSTQKSQIFAL